MLQKDYYNVNNGLLTRSKIQDYLKGKEYFYKKHIVGEVGKNISDPLIVGNAVDCWLTEGKREYNKRYYIPRKQNGDPTSRDTNSEDYEYQLTPAMEQMIKDISEKVQKQPVYKRLMKEYEKQKILMVEDNDLGEHFTHIAGIPDFIKIDQDNKKCIIVDYKTASTIEKKKYYFKCREFGYFSQQALYQWLVSRMFPKIEHFESYHLVTEKDSEKIYNNQLFKIPQHEVEREKQNLVNIIYNDIAKEKTFKDHRLDWDDVESLGEEDENFNFIDI